jgi:hypothetical protein
VNLEAIALIITKFSEELIAAQLALLLLCSATALYLLLVRKKKKESAEWVPASLVRAYLDRVQADERETRLKLFGEASPAYTVPSAHAAPLAAALGTTVADPNLLRELEALRAQLALSDQRAIEFDRNMNALKAEKAALEQRLRDAANGAPAAAAAGPGSPEFVALQKEAEDMKAKLQEYSVIEDDLANLKKFQKENEQLKQRIGQLEGGAASATTIAGTPPAAAVKTVVSGGEQKSQPGMVLVSGGASAAPAETMAPPAATGTVATAAPAAAPVAAAAPAPAPGGAEQNTNVLQSVTPAVDAGAPAAPAAEKSSKQKEEELLSEFEKMLAS